MLYDAYEVQRSLLTGASKLAGLGAGWLNNPANPFGYSSMGPLVAAGLDVFAHASAPRGKPEFGIVEVPVGKKLVQVDEDVVLRKAFGQLKRFRKVDVDQGEPLLIVAPMSGHYATLLRGTVESMLPYAEVYITDWTDARMVPLAAGSFDLDDYIDYVIDMFHHLGPDSHVMAVCQPSVPVLAAVALMEKRGDPDAPATMVLMGGPIDTRENPTAVNRLAEERGIDWFRDNVVMSVPWPNPGFMRMVYPGFLQLSGFMSMNLDRHIIAHKDFFLHLVKNDGDGAEKHREFYDEYLAVMDLTAEFYLQTVETVFVDHALPKGEMMHRGELIEPAAIRNVALMTVEGENDDISGLGQTKAAHKLCTGIPDDMRVHYMQPAVGHYGVFNGSRFRSEIVPRIVDFIASYGRTSRPAPKPRQTRKAKS